MQWSLRRAVASVLVTVIALTAAEMAGAVEVTFDFNDYPDDCGETTSFGECYEPIYTRGGLTLSHSRGPDIGRATWAGADSEVPAGEMNLGTFSEGSSAVSTTMNFSQPVSSISLNAFNNQVDTAVTLTPILVGGGDGTPVRTVPYSDGISHPIVPITGGPYIGLRINAPRPYIFGWDDLVVTTAPTGSSSTNPRAVPTPVGSNVSVLNVDVFKSKASQVVYGGTTEADFCVAQDLRETRKNNKDVFVPRFLSLKEVAGTGSCKGAIPPTAVGVAGVTTWPALLALTDLQVPPWYRSFKSTFQGTTGYWFVIGIVRSSAEYSGPVSALPYPEKLITFAPGDLQPNGELRCNTSIDKRPLSLGGTVAAFNDFMNVEDERMIVDTAQCDGQLSLTRRTTHLYPMRLDGQFLSEAANIETQLGGLNRTLNRANACLLPVQRPAITTMRTLLNGAQIDILLGRWAQAITKLEQIARTAKAASFTSCGTEPYSNYKGAFMSRALAASFTVWDRFKYRTGTWQQYPVPGDLGVPLVYPPKP